MTNEEDYVAVGGNFTSLTSATYFNAGTLEVKGDFTTTAVLCATGTHKTILSGDSKGSLSMNQLEDYVVIHGDMYVETDADTRGKMTEGTLELKGSFIQKKTVSRYSFVSQGNHKLLYSGERAQTISMEDSAVGYSGLNHVELTNQSEEGICFENRPLIAGTVTDRARKVTGQIGVSATTQFTENYFSGSVYTLQAIQIKTGQEWTIGGELVVAGSLTVNGKVYVKGNVQIGANNFYYSEIIMQNGSLCVDGNLEHINTSSRKNLHMKNESSYVLVRGDFVFYPGNIGTFQAGTLEVKGDFTTGNTFGATGSHKLILSGDKKQTITTLDGSYFNIIELQNYSQEGVYSAKALLKKQLIRNGCKLVYGELEGGFGYTLNADETISGNFVLIDDTLDLNGHTLLVKGNLVHAAGEIKLNGGTLIVEGDYRQQVPEGDSYSAGKSFLTMTRPEDMVVIQGDMYVETLADTRGKLTDGILELQGDFIQKKNTNRYSFVAEGNHKILLRGSGGQIVNMEDTAINFSGLNHVEIHNQSKEGVIFANRPYVKGAVTDLSRNATGQIGIANTTSLPYGYFSGGMCMLQNININEEETWTISGDLEICVQLNVCGKLFVNGDVIVNSNYYHYGINMQGGSLRIEGDLNFSTNNMTKFFRMTHESDSVYVGGDVTCYVPSGNELTAGVLEVKGDFKANSYFQATGTHKIILSGDNKQTVTLAEGAYFNTLELKNYSEEGIYSKNPIPRAKLIRNGCKLTYEGIDGTYGYTLEEDEVVSEDFILLDDTLNLNGHTLHIKGDFIQPAGEIVLNGGKLIVEGDYRQQSLEIDSFVKGSGSISMNQPDDYVLIHGDMYVETNADTREKMTDGVLEIKGSFVQKKTANRYNFVPSGNHKLLFSGSKAQTISMEDSALGYSCLNHVEFANQSKNGITFENRPYIAGNIVDTTEKVNGLIGISNTTSFPKEYFGGSIYPLENIRLSADEVWIIGGDMELSKKLEISGNLHVKGNMQVTSLNYYFGIIMQGGYLQVDGNLESDTTDYQKYLQMTHESDTIIVLGDFNYYLPKAESIIAGTLEVKGDFTVNKNFQASGNHKTILSGEDRQIVELADGASLSVLELKNYSEEGVYSKQAIKAKELIRNGCRLTYGNMEGIFGFTLQQDYNVQGDLILMEDTMDLNGYTLTVDGDFIHAGGEVYVHGGTLIVKGDYRQQVKSEDENGISYGLSNSLLKMTNEKDQVVIEGNCYLQTIKETNGNLTAGILNIKGDFIQLGEQGFHAGKAHTISFNGVDKQVYSANTPSTFGTITIANTNEDGVVFQANANVLGNVCDEKQKVSGTGSILIKDLARIKNNCYGGSITLTEDDALESDFVCGGNLTIEKTLSLSANELHAGNIGVSGTLDLERGTVISNKHFTVSSKGSIVMNQSEVCLQVNGDFLFHSEQPHEGLLTNGVLEVNGDFIQSQKARFMATESHTTILGETKSGSLAPTIQTITFENPSIARFHTLILKKNRNKGYIFSHTPENIADEVIEDVKDETPPGMISSLSANQITVTKITLCYEAAEDDNVIDGYEIYRDGRKIATTRELTYTDTALEPDTTYTYQVYAFEQMY